MIGLVAVTAAGRAQADRLADAWPDARRYPAPAATALPAAFGECDGVVCFLATGATVRLLAPLLAAKHADPGVVCVDEAGRFAVALVGGHAGGANALAYRVAAVLGAQPVVTTASDARGTVALDGLADAGLRLEPGPGAAAVAAALLDGRPVGLDVRTPWPLPALPAHVTPGTGRPAIVVSDAVLPAEPDVAVLRPATLVVGVGASRGVATGEVLGLLDAALADAGLSPLSVVHLATVEAKRDETGIVEAARARGWPLVLHPAALLARVDVPHPSEVVRAAVGTPSVAEASALVGGGELLVAKRASAAATVAVARRPARGRLALVGLGPGARDLLTPRAAAELARAAVVVGLDQYVDQVRDLLRPGTEVLASGLGEEEARARTAVEQARAGRAVALLGSGDAGVYGMASPALDLLGDAGTDGGAGMDGNGDGDGDGDGNGNGGGGGGGDAGTGGGGRGTGVEVVGVPGVTAALAASALLGAPLGHDHASVSLSDLHTSWEAIERRLRAVAEGDLVVSLYNPRSRTRDWQLPKALALLAEHRPPGTPVGLVHAASRPDERVHVTTLAEVDVTLVDMTTTVVVGSSRSRIVGGRIVTPRDYRWAAE